jgi:hypothetical protein
MIMTDVVTQAYNDFMTRMFGVVPTNPEEYEISEADYITHMKAIQEIYGLYQGHKDFLEFMLTILGRSPQIIRGAGEDGTKSTD